jgi:hypothetical protein
MPDRFYVTFVWFRDHGRWTMTSDKKMTTIAGPMRQDDAQGTVQNLARDPRAHEHAINYLIDKFRH